MPEMFVLPFRPAYDANGRFAPGAQAWFTLTGTNTPSPVYSDAALTGPRDNPLVADGLGKFPRSYLDPAVTYRVRVYDADSTVGVDAVIDDHDYDPYTGQEQGAEGPQGESAVAVTIGTTTTGAAGSDAIVVNSGTATNPILDFTIPRGNTGAGSTIADGDYGDITVSGTGTIYTVDAAAITLAKMANIGTDTVIGRQTAGTGVPEAVPIGAAAATDILDRAAGDGRYILQTGSRVVSLPVPAAAMKPRTTTGAATGSNETTTNKVNYDSLDFDASTAEYAQFWLPMPKSWNESTVTAQFIWTAASGSGDVVWGIQAIAFSNDDALDTAFGTAAEVTDTLLTAGDQHTTSFTGNLTIGGTPAENDLVCFQVYRKAADGADTLAVDAKLIALRLNFTVNAQDDS